MADIHQPGTPRQRSDREMPPVLPAVVWHGRTKTVGAGARRATGDSPSRRT